MSVPRRRIGTIGAALVLVGTSVIVPAAGALAAIINPAGGGSAISADQFGTSRYTPLTGVAIAESTAGELALDSTTVLNIPSGFRFHAGTGTLSKSPGCDLKANLKVTTTQATITVSRASTVANCIVTVVGLEVQPTSGAGLTSGNITKTGTSAVPAGATNYGTLNKVAGAVSELVFVTQPSANNTGGRPFGTQPEILARDQFGNAVAKASVTLSIAPGTGASGAHLRCTRNPVKTSGAGVADFDAGSCSIDRAAKYKLRAKAGSVTRNSGTLQVAVGPAAKIVFRTYPGATTKTRFAVQPSVAVTDAGGNTVTTYPATRISLAINRKSSTFTCTDGRVATTVKGVAVFKGCSQTTTGSGYRLTAIVGFATVLGRAFSVVK